MAKFRLMASQHVQREPDGTRGFYAATPDYQPIIESDIDLVKRFGSKFQRVSEQTPADKPGEPPKANHNQSASDDPPTVNDEFTSMTVAQLHEYAQAHEIDLGTASRKAEILDVLRASRS